VKSIRYSPAQNMMPISESIWPRPAPTTRQLGQDQVKESAIKAERLPRPYAWRVNRSAAVNMADDGYVLEYRNFDEGKNPFSWNIDRKTMTPLNMSTRLWALALRAGHRKPTKPARSSRATMPCR
jgi:hypothetical protein